MIIPSYIEVCLAINEIEEDVLITLSLSEDLSFFSISGITDDFCWFESEPNKVWRMKRADFIQLNIKKAKDRLVEKYGYSILALFKMAKGISSIGCFDKEMKLIEEYGSWGISACLHEDNSYHASDYELNKDILVATMRKVD